MKELAERGEKWGRANGRSPYDVMNTSDLAALPVGDLFHKDAALFFWATMPKLKDAFTVLEGWGFEQKTTAFTWIKLTRQAYRNFEKWRHTDMTGEEIIEKLFHAGNGYYCMANAELCLLARRKNGSPKRVRKDVRSLIVTPLSDHSAKPKEVHRRIERLMGDLSRIELFARNREPGWDAVGMELTGNDIRVDISRILTK